MIWLGRGPGGWLQYAGTGAALQPHMRLKFAFIVMWMGKSIRAASRR